jgi:hypothetical protein
LRSVPEGNYRRMRAVHARNEGRTLGRSPPPGRSGVTASLLGYEQPDEKGVEEITGEKNRVATGRTRWS